MSAEAQPPDSIATPPPRRSGRTNGASVEADSRARSPLGYSLFWRTFMLLALLLLGSAIGWYQLFRTLEYEPRVIDNARQVASLVNLSRAALMHSDAIARVSLITTLADQEKVRIDTREPGDKFDLFNQIELERRMSAEIIARLGPGTVVASRVNGEPGLWVGFSIEGDSYWVLTDRSRIGGLLGGSAWLLWLAMLGALSLVGAALLAGFINRPLRQLSIAAAHVREGDFERWRLDESARSREIRAVNIGFNRMAEQLSKIEQDRAEMLAGISHDLRTPLARLRLETEMSVPDAEAREHMVADIEQVDTIIDKFLDYARPGHLELHALPLADIVAAAAQPFMVGNDIEVQMDVAPGLRVMGDDVELSRVLANLLENARRYGRSDGSGLAQVDISATARDQWVALHVRDHGPGVPPELLPSLTRPFFRGDRARTAATGAGLGLAIVAKMAQNMGGVLELENHPAGGLMAVVRLRQATDPKVNGSLLKKRR